MIKIYDGEVFTLDYNTYDKISVLTNCLNYSKRTTLRFIVYENSQVKCALSIADILNNIPMTNTTITLSQNMFIEANEIFESNPSISCIPVLNESGQCLFLLEYQNDAIITGTSNSTWDMPLYFEHDVFIDNTYDFIDLSMFDNIDNVVIYNIEQYTHRIIQVLLKNKPDIHIFALDSNASLLFNSKEVTVLDNIHKIREYNHRKNCMYISSDYYFPQTIIPADILNIYSSYDILYTIFMIKKISHYGELYPDKTIYLINPPTKLHGLVDIMKYTFMHAVYAKHHGWIPVVDLSTKPNYYLLNDNDNMWEYFFSPLSDITTDEAYKCKNVINMYDNNLSLKEEIFNINMALTNALLFYHKPCEFNQFIQLNEATKIHCINNIPPEFNGSNRILGVIMRGTDFRKTSKDCAKINHGSQDIEVVINRINELISIWNYDYVYVATEETEYLEILKNEYGDKLLFTEQKRVTYSRDFDDKYILELLDLDNNNTLLQYLTAIYALSKCNGIVTSVYCGPYLLSNLWKDGEYEVREIVQ